MRSRLPISVLLSMFIMAWSTGVIQAQPDHHYNRFQYHDYKWQAFHTSAFHIYFPKGYDSLCAFTAKELPGITERIRHRMIASLQKEPNIVIYPSTDHLYETNIGGGEPVRYTLPTVVLKGNRIVLSYGGSYENMKAQLAEGVVRALWEEQFNNGLSEQLKGPLVQDKMPDWFKEGLIQYIANNWTIYNEDQLQRSYQQNDFQSWQEVVAYQPKLSGTAFCYFLTRQYYPQAVLQLYNQLKKKRDLARAIRLVAKQPLDTVMNNWFLFYKNRFTAQTADNVAEVTTLSIPHPKGIVRAIQANNDLIAYTLYTTGQRNIYIHDLRGKNTRLASYKLPPWISDHSKDPYPIFRWKKEKQELLVIYPKKGKLQLETFTATGKLQDRQLRNLDGITALEPDNNHNLLLAAYRKGQSDIISYDERKEKYTAITNDSYDETQPAYNGATGETIFVSPKMLRRPNSRDNDSLYRAQGLFTTKNKLPIVADTLPYIEWDKPVVLANGELLATHTRYGAERFALVNTSGIKTLTAYKPFNISDNGNNIHFYHSTKDSIRIQRYHTGSWVDGYKAGENDTLTPWLLDYHHDAAARAKEDSILAAAKNNSEPSFLEGVLKPKNSKELAQKRKDSLYNSLQYDADRIEPYILQLHSAYFSARVNNDYFINRYQPYIGYLGQFKFPEVGGMATGGFTDLFEDHHFNVGYRLPTATEGSDLFIKYLNTKKRTDWSIQYFRKVETLQPDPKRKWEDEFGNPYPHNAKVKTHYYELSLHHPLSYYTAIDFTNAIRKDRTIFLATEKYSLRFDDLKTTWWLSTLAGTYNKLQPTIPLLYKGFTAKAMLDLFIGLQGATRDGLYGMNINLQYHKPLYKYITAVLSLKAGHSGGNRKVLYNMGGVDNNLTVKTDTSVHFNQNAPYAFQTLITPLRGYLQNTIYGNQYALANADIYFPVFQTLIPIETNFSSINNLQPGLFCDMAYARETWTSNAKGRSNIAYGLSLRTSLAGYAIRVDAAMPNATNKKLLWYLSLNL